MVEHNMTLSWNLHATSQHNFEFRPQDANKNILFRIQKIFSEKCKITSLEVLHCFEMGLDINRVALLVPGVKLDSLLVRVRVRVYG